MPLSISMSSGGKAIAEITTSRTFRLILDGYASGARNMAADEALLNSVSSGQSGPVIRLYAFAPGTLSTGRFQKVREEFDLPRMQRDGISLVRRPSGGRAVLHNNELTYSVVLGKHHIEPFSKRRVYAFIVPVLLSGLSELGLTTAVNTATRGDLRNPDCFASSGEYEIDSREGKKLIGSAQMLTREAVLQHGSIPISGEDRDLSAYLLPVPSNGKPEELHIHQPSSIADELGWHPDFPEVRDAFQRAVQKILDVRIDRLTEDEEYMARELEETKFSRDSWNLMQ